MLENGFNNAAMSTGLRIKQSHTIIKKWPRQLAYTATKEEVLDALEQGHTADQRYVEWCLAPSSKTQVPPREAVKQPAAGSSETQVSPREAVEESEASSCTLKESPKNSEQSVLPGQGGSVLPDPAEFALPEIFGVAESEASTNTLHETLKDPEEFVLSEPEESALPEPEASTSAPQVTRGITNVLSVPELRAVKKPEAWTSAPQETIEGLEVFFLPEFFIVPDVVAVENPEKLTSAL